MNDKLGANMKRTLKKFWEVDILCCNKSWGLFDSKQEARREAKAVEHCHRTYYAYQEKNGRQTHLTNIGIYLKEVA